MGVVFRVLSYWISYRGMGRSQIVTWFSSPRGGICDFSHVVKLKNLEGGYPRLAGRVGQAAADKNVRA